jgi:hypothetical protein
MAFGKAGLSEKSPCDAALTSAGGPRREACAGAAIHIDAARQRKGFLPTLTSRCFNEYFPDSPRTGAYH